MCPRTLIILTFIRVVWCVKIDLIDCGVDHVNEVTVGDIEIEEYAWLGILYYTDEFMDGFRSTTPVVLIHEAFCLASASDINDMPKEHFRANSRVLIGEDWTSPSRGRRVRNYVLHPEFGETLNTLAIIHLKDAVRNGVIRHVCPPPEILHDPDFFVIRFKNDYTNLQKEVIPMYYVPPRLCRDFYVAAKLYEEKMRPPHVVCACSMEHDDVCVWEAGSVLMTRDVWGRWQLLGFGVRGPGCSAPSRYLDMLSYYPWVHVSLHRFQQITISKIHNYKYVLRSTGAGATRQGGFITKPTGKTNLKQQHPDIKLMIERFGDCDPEEKPFLLYREFIILRTDNMQFQFFTYNLTINEAMEISCMTLELINATAGAEMKIRHFCPRQTFGPPCYAYKGSLFDISVFFIFNDKCLFEMNVWGFEREMKLVDALIWRWEEGTFYEDFTMHRVEYLGPSFMTGFGFEPLDEHMWLPNYDIYSTTEERNHTTPSTTEHPVKDVDAKREKPKDRGDTVPGAAPTRRPKSGTILTKVPTWFKG